MSKNFFSALDDSDNENDAPAAVAKKDTTNKSKATRITIAEPSKTDRRRDGPDQRRNTRQGRGGRAAPREGKRAYERRSGTGRGREIKKEGGGARNWGSERNMARHAEGAVEEGKEDEQVMIQEEERPEEEAVKEEEEEEEKQPEKEEDKTLSYEEYMKTKSKPDSELFASVQERKVENEFANMKAKVAVEEDFLVMGGGKAHKKKGPKDNKEKKSVDVGFRVTNPNPGGRRDDRRDGRGRGRGRSSRSGGRGGGRGGRDRSRGQADDGINLTDSSAFPTL